jgi:hypothetical protein
MTLTAQEKRALTRRRRERKNLARALFLGALATAIIVHEVFILPPTSPRPVALFVALWLLGLVPVSMADEARRRAASLISPAGPPEGAPGQVSSEEEQ